MEGQKVNDTKSMDSNKGDGADQIKWGKYHDP